VKIGANVRHGRAPEKRQGRQGQSRKSHRYYISPTWIETRNPTELICAEICVDDVPDFST